jgi:hypothetical protein
MVSISAIANGGASNWKIASYAEPIIDPAVDQPNPKRFPRGPL